MANPVWTDTALRELAALGDFPARAADTIRSMKLGLEGLRKNADKANAKKDIAERQVRDLARTIDRLNREIATLKSQCPAHSQNR